MRRRRIEDGEDDDILDTFDGTFLKLCETSSSKAAGAVRILTILKAGSN